MTNHEEYNFSLLIRTEFDKMLASSSQDDSVGSAMNDSLSSDSLHANVALDPKRKWSPGKCWDDDELKSLVEIDYEIEKYSLPKYPPKVPKKTHGIKKMSENANSGRNQNINLVDLKGGKNRLLIQFGMNTNVQKSIQLQCYLTNLTEENFEETAKALYNQNYCTSKQNIFKLMHEIISVVSIRKEKTHLLVKLIQFIITKSSNVIAAELSPDADATAPITAEALILSILLKPSGNDDNEYLTNVPKLYLLKHCLNANVLTANQIAIAISDVIAEYPANTNYHNLLFCYFAQTIESSDKNLADKIFRKIDSTSWYSSTQLRGTLHEFYDLKKKHWKEMVYLTENGLLEGSVEQIIEQDNLEALKREFQKGASKLCCLRTVFSPNAWSLKKMTMIEWAALCGSISVFKYLMVNEGDLSMIAPFAIAGGNDEIYELCKKNENQRQSLQAAAEFRRFSVFDVLFKFARKNDYNELLCYCSKSNNLRGCQCCINSGANINYHSGLENEMTALLQASRCGHIDITSYLLTCSFTNVNVTDNEKNTPLHLASRNNRYQIICLLLTSSETYVNSLNKFGRTPLHEAAIHGCIDCVKILAAVNDIKLNIKDCNGMTPIMCANRFGQTEVADFLSTLPNIESDLTQKKITITAAKAISSNDDFSRSDLSADELSTDISIDSILFTDFSNPKIN